MNINQIRVVLYLLKESSPYKLKQINYKVKDNESVVIQSLDDDGNIKQCFNAVSVVDLFANMPFVSCYLDYNKQDDCVQLNIF